MGMFSSQIATKKMVPLCRQLATAYEAGIPIVQTLKTAGDGVGDREVRRVMTSMADQLKSGSTLGEAAKTESKHLNPFFVNLLASGEAGGHLDVMLRDLADYFEDRLDMQRRVVGMMVYPAIQLTLAWFLGTFALGLIGVKGIDGIFEYIETVYVPLQVFALVLFAGGMLAAAALARAGVLSNVTGLVTTHIWPLSKVTQKFALARFFRSFALLLGSGLGMTACIQSAASITGNAYIERDLLKAVPKVRAGHTLVEAFAGSRTLSPMSREMLAVGEESGNLEQQMKKIAEYHLAEASHATAIATRVFSVFVAIAVACVVGYVIISFYANLYGGIFDELGI